MKQEYSTPNNNDRDLGYKFRKSYWDALYFEWNGREQRYRYMSGSSVSDAVLNSDNLIKTHKGNTMKNNSIDNTNKNYIGTDEISITIKVSTPSTFDEICSIRIDIPKHMSHHNRVEGVAILIDELTKALKEETGR